LKKIDRAGLSETRPEIKKVFADASPKELRTLETVLKKLASVPRIWGPESIQSVYANDEIAV